MKIITVLGAVALCGAVITGIWWLFYFLWNEIATGVFGAPELSFWQSVGLFLLISILTHGLRGKQE